MQPLTILGVGNVLCTDDGFGPAVASRLAKTMRGEGVNIVDGGTLGLSLLPLLEDSERIILIDAVRAEQPPGTMLRLEGEDVLPAVRLRLSPHQVGVADLLDAARLRGTMPDALVLVGVVPESIDLGFGLSGPVEQAVPGVIDEVVRAAEAMGFPLRGLSEDEEASVAVPRSDVALLRQSG